MIVLKSNLLNEKHQIINWSRAISLKIGGCDESLHYNVQDSIIFWDSPQLRGSLVISNGP